MGGACNTHGGGVGDVRKSFWCGNPRERDHLEDPCIDGRIIFSRFFRKWNGVMYWIDLDQDRDRWRALVNTVMNFFSIIMPSVS